MNDYIILNSDHTKVQVMSFQEGISIDEHIKKAVIAMYESSGNKSETYTVHQLPRRTVEYIISRSTITTVKETIR